jgi:hypothetical protein
VALLANAHQSASHIRTIHLQGLGLAAQLTSLHLECVVSDDTVYNRRYDGPVCAAFSRLARLQRLSLKFISTVPSGDCLALTALTGLTHLSLVQAHRAVGDSGAVALACSLKQPLGVGGLRPGLLCMYCCYCTPQPFDVP